MKPAPCSQRDVEPLWEAAGNKFTKKRGRRQLNHVILTAKPPHFFAQYNLIDFQSAEQTMHILIQSQTTAPKFTCHFQYVTESCKLY